MRNNRLAMLAALALVASASSTGSVAHPYAQPVAPRPRPLTPEEEEQQLARWSAEQERDEWNRAVERKKQAKRARKQLAAAGEPV